MRPVSGVSPSNSNVVVETFTTMPTIQDLYLRLQLSVSWRVSPSGADENSDDRSDSLNGNCGCARFDIRIQLRKEVGDAMDVNLVGKNMVRNSTSQGPLQLDK